MSLHTQFRWTVLLALLLALVAWAAEGVARPVAAAGNADPSYRLLLPAMGRAVSAPAPAFAPVAGGSSHTCALTAAGGVLCWGANGGGRLGDGTSEARLTPTPVSGLGSGVTAIAVGGSHTCALTQAGSVLCWGNNWYGQLGDGSTESRFTPTPVTGLGAGVTAISAAGSHTCALTQAGGVLCWGATGTANWATARQKVV